MAAAGLECPYEASDEASESELLDRSLSVWRGRASLEGTGEGDEFAPIPLDLHTASSIGHYDSVRNIIQRGEQDLNSKNRGGWTPLMYACYIGHDNVVNLLLDARVNVNVKNVKGQTPLMLAASCGNESVAYFLLQQGAELEARDKKGWTALFHATYSGHQNMVKFLLENSADMEARITMGPTTALNKYIEPTKDYTPFMVAAALGHEIIVQLFLQHDVGVNARDCNGDTARSLALIYGHMKIVSLIDNHILGVSSVPRAEPVLRPADDLSSSDEAVQRPRRHPGNKSSRKSSKGPSIRDGPEAFAKLVNRDVHLALNRDVQLAQPMTTENSCVPKGYVTFKTDNVSEPEAGHIRSRDVTSPIDPEDHSGSLDSSGGRELVECDDDTNAFSKTGALTIKSSSSSSGGLVAAFGISRQGSTDDDSSAALDEVRSDPGQRPSAQKPTHRQKSDEGTHKPVTDSARKRDSSTRSRKVQMETKDHRSHGTKSQKADTPTARVPPFPPPGNKSALPVHVLNPQPSLPQEASYPVGSPVVNAPPADPRASDKLPAPPGTMGVRISSQDAAMTRGCSRSQDLASLLHELGMDKYMVVFEEQDVDLHVFLSLTDNDLKEVGIKLFGPRRKMTNAIARWHSNAPPSSASLEQAYADKLEAEMQEMAIQLHQAYEHVSQLKAQVLQEHKLRSVTEGCLMEDRASWQHVHHLATDLRQRCSEIQEQVKSAKRYTEELSAHLSSMPSPRRDSDDSLVRALHQGLPPGLGLQPLPAAPPHPSASAMGIGPSRIPASSPSGSPAPSRRPPGSRESQTGAAGMADNSPLMTLVRKLDASHSEMWHTTAIAMLNIDKLLGHHGDYGDVAVRAGGGGALGDREEGFS